MLEGRQINWKRPRIKSRHIIRVHKFIATSIQIIMYDEREQGGSFSDGVRTGNELSAKDVVNISMDGYYIITANITLTA